MGGKRIGYQPTGDSIVAMFAHAERAKRFERYSDDDLAAAAAEVEGIPLSPGEKGLLDDIKAEIGRRTTLRERGFAKDMHNE